MNRPATKPSRAAPQTHGPKYQHSPSREEVLNYLGKLADDYHLPEKLVYAVADAESRFDVNLVHENIGH